MADMEYCLHVTISKILRSDWISCIINKSTLLYGQTQTQNSSQGNFVHTKCIVDYFDIFIEQSLPFIARAATFLNYKRHKLRFYWCYMHQQVQLCLVFSLRVSDYTTV